jgi:hypothetical protein
MTTPTKPGAIRAAVPDNRAGRRRVPGRGDGVRVQRAGRGGIEGHDRESPKPHRGQAMSRAMSAARAAALKRSLAAEVHARGLSSRSERELRRMKPGELRRLLARAEDRARSAEIAKERMTAEKETRE